MTGFNLTTTTTKFAYYLPAPSSSQVSKPRRPEKAGVFSNISMICSLDCVGGFGGGPPPVFLLSLLKEENSFFAVEWRFFYLSLTSCIVRFS